MLTFSTYLLQKKYLSMLTIIEKILSMITVYLCKFSKFEISFMNRMLIFLCFFVLSLELPQDPGGWRV